MEKDIRKNANQLFESGDFKGCLKELSILSSERISIEILSKGYFKQRDFEEIFSEHYCFSKIIDSEESDNFLHQLFTQSQFFSNHVEKKLIANFPLKFVKAVRVNQLFLDEENLKRLLSYELPDDLKVHQKVWSLLQQSYSKIWISLEKNLEKIKSKRNPYEVLAEVVIQLEEKRFENPFLPGISLLAKVYSYFVELYFSGSTYTKAKKISKENFEDIFLNQIKSEKRDNVISNFLKKIEEWVQFDDTTLSLYCFDLNINPVMENGMVYFKQSADSYYKWKLDGFRYLLNYKHYISEGTEITNQLIENGDLQIPGITLKDNEVNKILTGDGISLEEFLKDLAIEDLKLNGEKVKTKFLFIPLITYSRNREVRYEKNLEDFNKVSKSWRKSFAKLKFHSIRQNNNLENYPFVCMSEEDYIGLNNKALELLPKNSSKEVINHFAWKVSKREIPRSYLKYDVFKKPFLRIGGLLFSPIMFFANNDWFYPIAQAILGILNFKYYRGEEKRTSQKFEENLEKVFKKKGWNVKLINDTESINMGKGDVDLFISDEKNTIFIQLKRTYFKLDPKSAYYETINVDKKAATQLNVAEKFLKKPNEIFELNGIPEKWIVTTSYEGILNKIDGCLKVNYFDLLRNIEDPEVNELSELIENIKQDKIIKDEFRKVINNITDEFIIYLSEIEGFPVPLKEPHNYNILLASDWEGYTDYRNIFGKALKFDRERKKKKAIRLLTRCLDMNSEDVDIYSGMGNIYGDLREFQNAFFHFEKALKLLPFDPFIGRNYMLTLFNARRFEEGIQYLLELCKRYPFVGDLGFLLKEKIDLIIKEKLWPEEKLIELKEEWDRIYN